MSSAARTSLVDELTTEMTLAVSDGILFQQAVADEVGISLNELKCITTLSFGGPTTAGAIAAATGLTTGAVTRMVDRLERAGWVSRAVDPADRRRVILTADPQRLREVDPLFTGMQRAWATVLAQLSEADLEMMRGVFARMRETTRALAGTMAQARAVR